MDKEKFVKRFVESYTPPLLGTDFQDPDGYIKDICDYWTEILDSALTEQRERDKKELVEGIEEIFPEIPEGTYVSEPTRMLKELRSDIIQLINKQ